MTFSTSFLAGRRDFVSTQASAPLFLAKLSVVRAVFFVARMTLAFAGLQHLPWRAPRKIQKNRLGVTWSCELKLCLHTPRLFGPTALLPRTPCICEGLEDARHHALQRRGHSPKGVAEGRRRWGLRHEADDEAHGGAQGYSVRQQEEEGRRLLRVDVGGA